MQARHSMLVAMVVLASGLMVGCSSYRETGGEQTVYATPREPLEARAESAIDLFLEQDPSMQSFFDTAAGYAVFPEVTKGAVGVGGAYGEGVVYEAGNVIGYAELKQATVGVQLGGQTYRQIVFFADAASLQRLKENHLEFAAQASAVAAAEGAATTADYREGVAVFTMPTGGLMFEAAIGGQQFTFQPTR